MVPVETLGWQESEFTVGRLSQMLRERAPLRVRIARVPNKRVFAPATAWAWLSSGESTGTVEELRAALANLPDPSVEPDNLRHVAQALGYRVTMRWSDSSPDGYYDLELERRFGEPKGQREELSVEPKRPSDTPQSAKDAGPDGERRSNAFTPRNIASGQRAATRDACWGNYANNPTQGAYERRLASALRNHLKEILPHYMVPAEFVLLDALPLLPNGKVNRAALPAPDAAQPETTRTFILPRTPAEHTLAHIWEELLGLERIGIHDNFFDLGGDSILSIQIIARANQSGLRLTPQKLFQHQTIAELAEVSDPAEAGSRSLDWRLEDTAPKKRALPQAARPVRQGYRRFEHSS